MAYPHKWSPISYKSSAAQRKHIGQRPMLYRWTTPPTDSLCVEADHAMDKTNIVCLLIIPSAISPTLTTSMILTFS